ncbi:glycosyltransferase family 4 protein [Leptolyngbya boryana CZ1]|uniref:Glycosyltransferase family 4 protein n=1 Tax=Leptolyngbya boryana CZ1 TaxID=3060204 RepID=A0AA97AR97_LEPBY|nr:glycosyltransferase family 4 protein [Leptolyngbya boryana]WNZ44005.1 glycosyltransferase family 4 protein [Leptolyngbya boryana CZ1]
MLPICSKDSDPCFVLFDLVVGGHHATYIQHFIEYWNSKRLRQPLYIIVAPEFAEVHADVYALAHDHASRNVHFVVISQAEAIAIQTSKSLIRRSFREWQLFCQYAKALNAAQALLMYFDHLQVAIALGSPAPCPVSGIYFRPTFHYASFAQHRASWQDRLRAWRQRLVLALAARNPRLTTLFCLDPFAISPIQKHVPRIQAVHLPDPVAPFEAASIDAAHPMSQAIEPERYVFLLFGNLDQRKGITQVLAAIKLLPREIIEKICLLLVGKLLPEDASTILSQIQTIEQTTPIQIVLHNRFVSESEMQHVFRRSDIVLIPYQRHVGMSGVLLQAAMAEKPVLASNYGLLGELVRTYELGITIETENCEQIAKSLASFVTDSRHRMGKVQNMQDFVQNHTPQHFVETILTTVKFPFELDWDSSTSRVVL